MLRAIPSASGQLELILVQPSSNDPFAESEQAIVDVINQIQGGVVVTTATAASLAALGAGMDDGAWAWVASRKRYYSLDRDSTDAPIAGVIVPAVGGGNWISVTFSSSLHWSIQDAWSINTTTGDDDGDGSAGEPLLTWGEFSRRVILAVRPYTVSIVGNLAPTDPIAWAPTVQWNRSISSSPPSLTVIGTETSGAPQAYAAGASKYVGNVGSQFTVASHGPWTVGQAIRTLTGAAAGSIALVSKDFGAGNAECSPWWSSTSFAETPAPAGGDTLVEVSWSTVPNVLVEGITSFFKNLSFTAVTVARGAAYLFIECKTPGIGTQVGFTATWSGCHVNNGFLNGQNPGSLHVFFGTFIDRTATTAAITYDGGAQFSTISTLIRGNAAGTTEGIAISGNMITPGGIGSLRLTQYFSIGFGATAGLDVSLGSIVKVDSALGGSGNGVAMNLHGGQVFVKTGVIPTVTGATELLVDGAASQIPPLVAGAVVPLAAPITTFAQWDAAPFSRFFTGNGTGSIIANAA